MYNVKFFCSDMTPAQRVEVTRAKSLKDMEKGSLLEIHSVEMKTGEFGAYGIASYSTTLKNGARSGGTVRLTSNATQQADMIAPCVLLYTGTKLGKHGKAFYDVHVVPAPSPDPEEHQKFADGLRAMASSALLNYMTLMSLERFDVGAIILFKDVRKKKLRKDSGEDALTVSFETDMLKDKGKASGTLIVPLRMEADLKRHGSGIMVYEGLKTSQLGRLYHHVNVVDESLLDVL